MEIKDFIEKSARVSSKDQAVFLISEFLGETTAPLIGVFGERGTKEYLEDYYESGAEDPSEHPLETTFRKSLTLVQILADKWDVAFDPVLYVSTIKCMELNDKGVWHSSSLDC